MNTFPPTLPDASGSAAFFPPGSSDAIDSRARRLTSGSSDFRAASSGGEQRAELGLQEPAHGLRCGLALARVVALELVDRAGQRVGLAGRERQQQEEEKAERAHGKNLRI
jgi:hypothetical protein